MPLPDLNLLIALNALLDEGSVVGAARRTELSTPAMSRALGRIRRVVGDPILVKVGRSMVPTPKAIALRDQVRESVRTATRILQPDRQVELSALQRHFNLYASDTFTGSFGGRLLDRVKQEAPHCVLRFMPETDAEVDVLTNDTADLHIDAMRQPGADVHVQSLFSTRFVGLARNDHPIFDEAITPGRFVAYEHIGVSRRGRTAGPIDTALVECNLERSVSLVVPTFYSAIFALCSSDLILPIPEHVAWSIEQMGVRVRRFAIPVPLEPVAIVQAWHPRFQSDQAHRWLRRVIYEMCSSVPA
ncbi:LysR family transcriptional regulator [Burkholderia sp. MSh2]|uniref:LysR family transcriptional regulator n=1 Tax=Burkholderia paludis TaxID=1506587 RepID=A0A6P2QZE9_9BURK|nr:MULTISPECIES: LysR family transcriptional regulator [Burkholderia]KEZ02179.1 LysR family transcriptional regulator [Burkholderia sp. MSh2]CAB3771638.1 Nodulation protein D 2 [Burkholderia paludis]VWC27949.1 LysR family transcriptional regulator [Burkholderia paludis]